MASRNTRENRGVSPSALKPSEVLAKAAEKISPRGAWTQEVSARDRTGIEVDEEDRAAVCWCASGAIYSQRQARYDVRVSACLYLERSLGQRIPDWNDSSRRTQAEVVAALRKASAIAASEGQ